jgi:hypothetical protein
MDDERVTPLEFLEEVYSCEDLPLRDRMKAAIEAAPFVHPKLAMTAVAHSTVDYGAVLRKRMVRTVKMFKERGDPETENFQRRLEDWNRKCPPVEGENAELPEEEGLGASLERLSREQRSLMDERQVPALGPERINGREGPKRRGLIRR